MKLGVLTNVIGETPLKEALAYFKSLGAQMVEIGCGGYPGKDHCDPGVLLLELPRQPRPSQQGDCQAV